MKKKATITLFALVLVLICQLGFSQQIKQKSDFWNKVQFGGGLGLGFGDGFTNISVSPSAIYNVNHYFAAGVSIQYGYLQQKNLYSSSQYGGSIIGLVNPIEQIQLSVELEQLRVNVDYENAALPSNDFWNTGLFLGAGYRSQNVTIGARYNVLFDNDKGVYGNALMPFVRFYF